MDQKISLAIMSKFNTKAIKEDVLTISSYILNNTQLNRKTISYNDAISLSEIFRKGRSELKLINYLEKNKIDINQNILNDLKASLNKRIIKSLNIINNSYKVLKLFEKKNIKFILLKGSQLILNYHLQPNERPIRDIDLLIDKNDILSAIEILYECGFSFRNQKEFNMNLDYSIDIHGYDIEPMFNAAGVCVEIHHKIFLEPQCSLSNDMWKYSIKKNYNNISLLKTPKELLSLHLIYHSTSKQGLDVGVQAINDLSFLMNKNNFNFNKLLKLSKDNGLFQETSIFLIFLNNINLIELDSAIQKKLIEFDNATQRDFSRLIIFNNANNHSLKLYSFNIKDFIFKYQSISILRGEKFIIKSKAMLFYLFFKRFFRHITRYTPILIKLIFFKAYRDDNKKSHRLLNALRKTY